MKLTPSRRHPFVKGRVGVASDLTLPVITLTLLGKIGFHLNTMTEIESQCAMNLFECQKRIAFLNTLRCMPIQIGIDKRGQRDAGTANVITICTFFNVGVIQLHVGESHYG